MTVNKSFYSSLPVQTPAQVLMGYSCENYHLKVMFTRAYLAYNLSYNSKAQIPSFGA